MTVSLVYDNLTNLNYITQLDLQLQDETGGDISSFVTNGEWDLLGLYSSVHYELEHLAMFGENAAISKRVKRLQHLSHLIYLLFKCRVLLKLR